MFIRGLIEFVHTFAAFPRSRAAQPLFLGRFHDASSDTGIRTSQVDSYTLRRLIAPDTCSGVASRGLRTLLQVGRLRGQVDRFRARGRENRRARLSKDSAAMHRGGLSGPRDFLDRHGKTADPKKDSVLELCLLWSDSTAHIKLTNLRSAGG